MAVRQVVAILRNITICAAALLCAESGFSAETIPNQKFETLLKKLDSNSFKRRQEAYQELLRQGPDLLPRINPEITRHPPAVQETLERLQVKLEQQQAILNFEPSRFSFQGTTSLRNLLNELEEETGNRLNLSSFPKSQLALQSEFNLNNTTFWETIDLLEHQFDFTYRDQDQLLTDSETTYTKQNIGSVRILLEKPLLKKTVGNESQSLFRLPILFQFEPRIRVLYLSWKGNQFQAHIDPEKSLPPFNPESSLQLSAGADHEIASRLDFLIDNRAINQTPNQKINLSGKCQVVLAAGEQELIFPLKREGEQEAIQRSGVSSVRLMRLTRSSRGEQPVTRIRLKVIYDASSPEPFESHRTWMFHDPVWIQSKMGEIYPRLPRFRTLKQNLGEITVDFEFPVLWEELEQPELHYRLPTLIRKVDLTIPPITLPLP